MNGSLASATMPEVEVFLSRTAYPLGSTIVGTILIHPSHKTEHEDLRSTLQSVMVYVAGYCRIDPRWHNVADYAKVYGKNHPYIQLLSPTWDTELLAPSSDPTATEETVCFWATEGLELLNLKERTIGKWKDIHDNIPLSRQRLAFTFRTEIPLDLPHSATHHTCRYFYSANVLIQTHRQQRVLKTPLTVTTNSAQELTPDHDNNSRIFGSRVKFGTIVGMAHSIGLPCHLSATEIHRPKGAISAKMPATPSVQTLRVSNSLGQPVCVMTLVGVSPSTPGSSMYLQWDFPKELQNDWLPCFQVSACLRAEELAVAGDSPSHRTRTWLLDTCHDWVDPGVTQRISKTLWLPMDAPCTIRTDVLDISTTLQVDLTVQEGPQAFPNLKLEFPCQVVHALGKASASSPEESWWVEAGYVDEDDEHNPQTLAELMGVTLEEEKAETGGFALRDIQSDLKRLALQMEERIRNQSSQNE